MGSGQYNSWALPSSPHGESPDEGLRASLKQVLDGVVEALGKVAGDKMDDIRHALEPLQQLVPQEPEDVRDEPQDPDVALARAFKAQAGVLRNLGQQKLQGEYKVTQARAQLQQQEQQLQKLQEDLVSAQQEMDRLTKQYSQQIVSRQLEPYGPPAEEEDMQVDGELQDQIKELQGALQTDDQRQVLDDLLRRCAHMDLQRKKRRVLDAVEIQDRQGRFVDGVLFG